MKLSETIFNGKSLIIPLADVQHIEKIDTQILIITDKTKWNHEHDCWENPICITEHNNQANEFIKAYCRYRAEIDGMTECGQLHEVEA